MLDIKNLKRDYQLKFFYLKGQNKRIYIREITFYEGSKKYRLIYEENLGELKYLNELTENELIEFLATLKVPEIKQISIMTDKKDSNNINLLTDKLYQVIDDLLNDNIKIEKAIAISKVTQTILNVEKLKQQLKIN